MDHLQEAKDVLDSIRPSCDEFDRQAADATRALTHVLIALIERLDAMTDAGKDKAK